MPAKGWDATRPPGSDPAAGSIAPPTGSTGTGTTASGASMAADSAPVVDDEGKKKRRKKKYSSKQARDFQDMGSAFSKGAFRMANAVAIGLETFHRSQNRSARKKRDGMVKDVMLNTAKGFRDAGQEAARAPYDIYKRVNVWRQARRAMKMFADPTGMLPKVK